MRAAERRSGKSFRRVAAVLCLAGFAVLCGAQSRPALVLPSAVVFNAAGDLYFAETANHIVRKFSTTGSVTAVAGNGVQGFSGDNGPGSAAKLDSPSGLAIDTAGNLYIADTHNQRVRELAAATGILTTIAGTGTAGFSGDGGAAATARLARPTALAIDAAGNLYIADTDNHRVRRIAAVTGTISTVAGNGVQAFAGDGSLATAASIDSPNGLAVDGAGNLYLADTHNGRVRRVDFASGKISTIAGTGAGNGDHQTFGGDGGAATAAGLALPRGLTLDAAGNLYLADSANHRIRRISSQGVISTVAGQGTQGFAGDGAPAVAANLDSPRSVAISPADLLTLADSANQRVRQVDAVSAPNIHTLATLEPPASSSLSLAGPSTTAYGSGALTASFTGTGTATGSVEFVDSSGGVQVSLGTATLTANSASFSIGMLTASSHSIVAMYGGDATHSSAQSAALTLVVTPLSLAATPTPASILYGQPVPALSGSLSGVLTSDAGKLSAVFSAAAGPLSPVGLYPIAATLTGSAAANYAVAVSAANLSITPAPTVLNLTVSPATQNLGLPVTLSAVVASSTSGLPTGSLTLLDGSSPLGTAQLSAGGVATLTLSTLGVGSHVLSAVYAGDPNFLSSSSSTVNLAMAAGSDFTLTAMGATTQSVPSGSAASFAFSVATLGASMSSPIALSVKGAPLGATASINPSYLPPGTASSNFSLTIQTPMAALDGRPLPRRSGQRPLLALLAVLLLPGIGLIRRRTPARWRTLGLALVSGASCVLFCGLAIGCGARVNSALESANAVTYSLTVTGTATSPAGTPLQHSVVVTLKVL